MKHPSLRVALLFVALAAIFFAPVLFTDRVLVPFDNLYQFPPWSSVASQNGVTLPPYNPLASDLLLENFAWKKFIVESIHARELPLWNPYLFAGVPFLAAGQHSALYPLSLLFYLLPIARAYGLFVALQFVIAMGAMFWFLRVLGVGRFGAIVSGIVFAFSGFYVVSVAFPMVLAAAAWLPAILACAEKIIRADKRRIAYAILGAIFLGLQFLAGHIEISLYNLIVLGFYSVFRALSLPGMRARALAGIMIVAMTFIGITLGAVQLIPLYEVVRNNFRVGSVDYSTVISYAFPVRQLVAFLIPDVFGNPTHHSYFDLFDFQSHPATGGTIFWGIKNYVEAGAYVGILPMVLALIALIFVSRFNRADPQSPQRSQVFLFGILALISLLFAFGTPLYAILFYGAPGFDQLHTPFRWIYPFTISMAVLAGFGAEILASRLTQGAGGTRERTWRLLTGALLAPGGLTLILLGLSLAFPSATLALFDRFLQSSNLARQAFDSARTFYSYEFRNILLLGVFLLGAGVVLWAASRSRQITGVYQSLVVILVVLDLFTIGSSFYPRADSRLEAFTPPAVKFLQADKSLYRITTYDSPDEKVFNANSGMLFGISDIRGYDSIIPKQYADYMRLLAPQDELLYNRIAPFYSPEAFDSPLLNLLNVKYVLSTRPLPNAGYTLVYDDQVKIYRNDRVLPRAFMVSRARVLLDRTGLTDAMTGLDPTREVLLEETPSETTSRDCAYQPVSFAKYTGGEVILKSAQTCSGWLVFADSFFPGWLAQVDEQDTHLYKADLNFRAVFVPAGAHTIRFKYSPISFRVGGIASFLGLMALVLAAAYLLWRRFYRAEQASDVHVVAKNSILPMATSLLMKVITLAFAFLSLRILGPTGTGRYAFAVTIWFFADTVTDFGLGILLTREVSRDRSQSNRYLSNSMILRVALWLATLIPAALVALIYMFLFGLTIDTVTALGFLMLGILPSSLAGSFAFLFNAYEKFEYRIAVDFGMRLVNVALSVVALLLGYGFIGLAAVSIITNMLTLGVFYALVRRSLFKPRFEMDRGLMRWMFFESYPLMINNLLSSLFFRIDVLILQPLKGDTVLGYYNTAYKFIDALNFIPSNFTLALFPALARSGQDAMLRTYILAVKILLWIALPLTVGTIFIAHDLVQIFGGDAYLPDSAIALQYLIWFLPFSFINSVTHYVLIALNQQRFLTKAFIIGVAFNIIANLIAIPPLGYIGAALVTIFSEIALLVPFYISVRRNLASIPFLKVAWRPAFAAGVMGLALWLLAAQVGLLIGVPIAGVLYAVLLIGLGTFGVEEQAMLRRLVPVRFHQMLRIAG